MAKKFKQWYTDKANTLVLWVFILLVIFLGASLYYGGNGLLKDGVNQTLILIRKMFLDKDGVVNISFIALMLTTFTLIWNIRTSNRSFKANQSTAIRKDSINEVAKLSNELIVLSNRSASSLRSLIDRKNTLQTLKEKPKLKAIGLTRKETEDYHNKELSRYVSLLNEHAKKAYEVYIQISLMVSDRNEYDALVKKSDKLAEGIQTYQIIWSDYVDYLKKDDKTDNDIEVDIDSNAEKKIKENEIFLNEFIDEAKNYIDKERNKIRKGK